MNHQWIHDKIIERASARAKPGEYCERHHIIPRSMGGSDAEENLVWLTAREHYLIHWLLYKIHRNPKMAFAWFHMSGKGPTGRRYVSHTFKYAKQAKSRAMSSLFTGRKHSEQQKQKMRAAKLGKTYAEMGRDPATSRKGKKLTPEQKARIGAASKGRKVSEETRRLLSESKLGALNPRFGKTPWNAKRKELEK